MDTSIENKIITSAISFFNNITLVDITNDKVTLFACNDTLKEVETKTYEEYFEKLKTVIHPDYLSEYFKTISLNNIQNSNSDIVWIKYMKLSRNLAYDNYLDAIKIFDDDKMLILTFKYNDLTNENKLSDDLKYSVADLIMNIESVLNNIKSNDYEINNAIKYINALTNDVLRNNESVLKEYENKVTVEANKTHRSLIITDDDNMTRNIFKKVFEKDYNIIEAKNGAEAVEIIDNNIINVNNTQTQNIVGIFLDLKMPVMDGFGVLNYLKEKRLLDRLPVVIISADDAKETKEQVYSYAIADMIEKPFNFELIKKRVNTMINMYAKSNILNNLVRVQDRELKDVIKNYAKAYLIDYADINKLIKKNGTILLNKLKEESNVLIDTDMFMETVKYYDISLDFVPRKYISNISSLSLEEKKMVTNYPNIGVNIIKYLTEDESESFGRYALDVILMHNERYDGLGFPYGKQKEEIPMYIYLINIAIEYSSYMLNHQDPSDIIQTIVSKSGSKYHPKAIEIFQKSIEEMSR